MEPREGAPVEGQGVRGVQLPDVGLPATDGNLVNLSRLAGRSVVFFYPYTGRPGHPDPEGWDEIPGAHGSTPQALAFSQLHDEFEKRSVKVFGVSFQTSKWQQEFFARNNLPFDLLSDAERNLSSVLQLETFRAGDEDFLRRRTVIVENAIITHDFYPIAKPAENAADVLKVLQA